MTYKYKHHDSKFLSESTPLHADILVVHVPEKFHLPVRSLGVHWTLEGPGQLLDRYSNANLCVQS